MKLFSRKSPEKPVVRRRLQDHMSAVTPRPMSDQAEKQVSPYRRNRTLTGSLSSNVTSVNERSSELKSPRVQKHVLHRHRRKIVFLLGAVSFAVLILGALLFQIIREVHVVSEKQISRPVESAHYSRLVNQYLNAHPFERFRFSLNTEGLTAYLQNNGASEVEHVSKNLTHDGIGIGFVTMRFRQPAVSWNTGGSQRYVDDTGAAFQRNYYPEPSVTVSDQSGVVVRDSQVLVSNRFLGFMGKVIGQMRQQGYEVASIIIPAGTTRQIHVQLKHVAYPIRFSTDRPAGEQSEDAARAVRYMGDNLLAAEYLDVRVSGRAFYK